MPRELITLQLGHSANFVGTHYWNELASYYPSSAEYFQDQSVYRVGELKGELTYTPRLLICDLKGSLRSFNPNELHAEGEGPIAWDGKIDRIRQEPIEKNEYLKGLDTDEIKLQSHSDELTSKVEVWSDFNGQYYHPNTVVELKDYAHKDPNNKFQYFNQGKEATSKLDWMNEFMDERVRRLIEECDSSQGFQIFSTADDGFSGMSSAVIESLREEYGKKGIFAFGICDSIIDPKTNPKIPKLNHTLLLNSAYENDALYVPLYMPRQSDLGSWSSSLNPKFDTLYQRSAFVASAIETITLPLRLTGDNYKGINDLQSLLSSARTRSISALSAGIIAIGETSKFGIPLKGGGWEWARDLTIQAKSNIENERNFTVFRGIAESLQHQSLPLENRFDVSKLPDYLRTTMCRLISGRPHSSLIFDLPFNINPSFPQYFTNLNAYGLKSLKPAEVCSVPLMASLHSGSSTDILIGRHLLDLEIKRDSMILHDFGEGMHGIDEYEWSDIRDRFQSFLED